MFLFGVGGSILPYIISIIAIWSGIWLGHAHLLRNNTNEPTSCSEINIENETRLNTDQSNTFEWSDIDSNEVKAVELKKEVKIGFLISCSFKFFHRSTPSIKQTFSSQHLRAPPCLV